MQTKTFFGSAVEVITEINKYLIAQKISARSILQLTSFPITQNGDCSIILTHDDTRRFADGSCIAMLSQNMSLEDFGKTLSTFKGAMEKEAPDEHIVETYFNNPFTGEYFWIHLSEADPKYRQN